MPDQTPNRMAELATAVRDFLGDLRPDELDTLKEIVKLPADDVRDGFKLVRELRAFGKWTRWIVLTAIAIFMGTLLLYERAVDFWRYTQGGLPK